MVDRFDDLEVLRLAEAVADEIWNLVSGWDGFARQTVGRQMVRAVDSIGANIAEAYGRYHYGEKRQFLYYARGSLFETKYWVNRCVQRGLLPADAAQQFAQKLSDTARQINAFARYIKKMQVSPPESPKSLREANAEYRAAEPESPPIFSKDDLTRLASIINSQ